MSKHTRGPWHVETGRSDWTIVGDEGGYSILAIPNDEDQGRPEEDAANANLIAAAPDMLDFIQICRTWFARHGDTGQAERAREIVAKAEGRVK